MKKEKIEQASCIQKINELTEVVNRMREELYVMHQRFRAIQNAPESNIGVLIINGKKYRVVPHCKDCMKNLCVMDIDTVNGLSTVVQCQKCGQFLKTFKES